MKFLKEFVNQEILEAEETADKLIITQAQDITPTLALNHELREHDETKGFTRERKMQHLASYPAIIESIMLKERPEVMRDAKEHRKWLNDPGPNGGMAFRVCKPALPVKGNGMQLIIKP